MSAKKVTEIRVEIEELILTRRVNRKLYAGCRACGHEVQFIGAEQAAAACNVSTRTIYRWIECGLIHHMETPGRLMFICLDSLLIEG